MSATAKHSRVSPGSPPSPGIDFNALKVSSPPSGEPSGIKRIPVYVVDTSEGSIGIEPRECSGPGWGGPTD
jgi:hypothetical protein